MIEAKTDYSVKEEVEREEEKGLYRKIEHLSATGPGVLSASVDV